MKTTSYLPSFFFFIIILLFCSEAIAQNGFVTPVREFSENGKTGLIDATGRIIVPCIYDRASYSSKGNCFLVKKDGRFGLLDLQAAELIPCKYDEVDIAYGNRPELTWVKLNGKSGVYETATGKELLACKYDFIESYFLNDSLSGIEMNGKKGIVNAKMQIIIPCIYQFIQPFYDGVAHATRNYKQGIIDKQGNEIIPIEYDNISGERNGLIQVSKKGMKGFYNTAGVLVIPCIYDEIRTGPENGVIGVTQGTKYFNIDYTGKRVK